MMSEEEQMRLVMEASMQDQPNPEPPKAPQTVIEVVSGHQFVLRWNIKASEDLHVKSYKDRDEALTHYLNLVKEKGAAIFYNFGQATQSSGEKDILMKLRKVKMNNPSNPESAVAIYHAPEEEKKAAAPLSKEAILTLIKKRFYRDNVYIHLCSGCNRVGQMLHANACILCKRPNEYFDESAKVDDGIDAQVKNLLLRVDRGLQIDVESFKNPQPPVRVAKESALT